jgi:hypothetical protein
MKERTPQEQARAGQITRFAPSPIPGPEDRNIVARGAKPWVDRPSPTFPSTSLREAEQHRSLGRPLPPARHPEPVGRRAGEGPGVREALSNPRLAPWGTVCRRAAASPLRSRFTLPSGISRNPSFCSIRAAAIANRLRRAPCPS